MFRCKSSRVFSAASLACCSASSCAFCCNAFVFRCKSSRAFTAASFARRSASSCAFGCKPFGFRCASSRAFAAASFARCSDSSWVFFSNPRAFRCESSVAFAAASLARRSASSCGLGTNPFAFRSASSLAFIAASSFARCCGSGCTVRAGVTTSFFPGVGVFTGSSLRTSGCGLLRSPIAGRTVVTAFGWNLGSGSGVRGAGGGACCLSNCWVGLATIGERGSCTMTGATMTGAGTTPGWRAIVATGATGMASSVFRCSRDL